MSRAVPRGIGRDCPHPPPGRLQREPMLQLPHAAHDLGWEPALQASGRMWIPPVLGPLLDDPYAAVRCVAERSLKRLAPSLIPAGYDYTGSPDSRPPIQAQVFERWSQEMAADRDQHL